MYPVPIASGRQVAALTSSGTRPLSVTLIATSDGKGRVLYPTLGRSFPLAMEVTPEQVILKAADGLQFHSQLFVPKDLEEVVRAWVSNHQKARDLLEEISRVDREKIEKREV